MLHLWLDGLAEIPFHFRLKLLLPLFTAPDKSPGPPEGELVFEYPLSLAFGLAARLLDPSKKSRYLPQRLVFTRLQKLIYAGELPFVMQDCVETGTNLIRQFTENYAGCPRGRLQFQDVRAGIRNHVIDLIFQRTEAALFPKPFFVQARGARQKRLSGGNGKYRRGEG